MKGYMKIPKQSFLLVYMVMCIGLIHASDENDQVVITEKRSVWVTNSSHRDASVQIESIMRTYLYTGDMHREKVESEKIIIESQQTILLSYLAYKGIKNVKTNTEHMIKVCEKAWLELFFIDSPISLRNYYKLTSAKESDVVFFEHSSLLEALAYGDFLIKAEEG